MNKGEGGRTSKMSIVIEVVSCKRGLSYVSGRPSKNTEIYEAANGKNTDFDFGENPIAVKTDWKKLQGSYQK